MKLTRRPRYVRQVYLPSPSRISPVLNGVMGTWHSGEGGPATPHRWGPSNLYLCGYR